MLFVSENPEHWYCYVTCPHVSFVKGIYTRKNYRNIRPRGYFIKAKPISSQQMMYQAMFNVEVNAFTLFKSLSNVLSAEHYLGTLSRSNWNLEMFILSGGENWYTRRKTSWSKDENQQQTQPTYDASSGNPTQLSLIWYVSWHASICCCIEKLRLSLSR